MTTGETVLTMVVGAALATLGGLLAQLLTYRLQSRTWKKDLLKHRLDQVWRYVAAGLEYADWICNVDTQSDGHLAPVEYDAWHHARTLIENRLKELPVRGTAATVTAGDAKLAALLDDFARALDPLVDDAQTVSTERRLPQSALAHRQVATAAAQRVFDRIQQLLQTGQ